MSTLPNGPQRFPTVQEVDAWLLAAKERRAQLHLHAASPLYTRRMALHHLLSPYEEPGNITVWGCLSHKMMRDYPPCV
jgi:hypothetical protein